MVEVTKAHESAVISANRFTAVNAIDVGCFKKRRKVRAVLVLKC